METKWNSDYKYYIDLSNKESLQEIMFEFIFKALDNASKTNKEIANSYWGLGMLSVVVPRNNAMIMSSAADLEQLAINDVTAINLKNKAINFLNNNDKTTELNINLKGELYKILAYIINTTSKKEDFTIDKKLSDESKKIKQKKINTLIENKIEYLFKAGGYSDNQINEIQKNENLQELLKLIPEFYDFVKEDYLKTPENSLFMVKSNQGLQEGVFLLNQEIIKENKKREKKIESLKIKEDYFNGEYNYDSIIFYGNQISTDEVKSGLPTLFSKYSANLKCLQNTVDLVTLIIANTTLSNHILFDMDKKLWKLSYEYKKAQEELKSLSENNILSQEEIYKIETKSEQDFIIRMIVSSIDFNTFPEAFLQTIIKTIDEEEHSKNIDVKYKVKQNKVMKTYEKSEIILDFCSIVKHPGKQYTLQIDEKIALIYIKNEAKKINYKLMITNLNEELDKIKPKITTDLKKQINNDFTKNLNDNLLVDINKIFISKEDFKSQLGYFLEDSEFSNKEQTFKIISDNIDKTYKEYFKNFNKSINGLNNTEMLELHSLIKANIKTYFNNQKDKNKVDPKIVNILIKNIYEYMNLDNLKIDENRVMFNNVNNILNKYIDKNLVSEILKNEELNPRKLPFDLANLISKDLIKNLTNVAKSMSNIVRGNVFRNICGGESEILKLNRCDFTKGLARGNYNIPERNDHNYIEKKESKLEKLSKTTQIGKEYLRFCYDFTEKLEVRGINSQQVIQPLFYKNNQDSINSIKELEREENNRRVQKIDEKLLHYNTFIHEVIDTDIDNEELEELFQIINNIVKISQNKKQSKTDIFYIESLTEDANKIVQKYKNIEIEYENIEVEY